MPVNYVTSSGYKLGTWQKNQRIEYRKGKLSLERIEALEKIGVVWDPHEVAWEEGFEHFLDMEPDSTGR